MPNVIKNLSWQDIENACLDVANQIAISDFTPTIILPVLWGGIVPARILIDIMGWNRLICKPIVARSYENSEQIKEINVNIPFDIAGAKEQKILIVEEIVDTSRTVKKTLDLLEDKHGCDPVNIEIATLYRRETRALRGFPINYWYQQIKDEWLIFPWDKHEYMRATYK